LIDVIIPGSAASSLPSLSSLPSFSSSSPSADCMILDSDKDNDDDDDDDNDTAAQQLQGEFISRGQAENPIEIP